MRRHPIIFATAALLAAFLLPACASWFGDAETPEQQAFRAAGKYVYIATPAANFAALANPDAGTLAAVCELDDAAYRAITTARQLLAAGGDRLSAALLGASSVLADFSLKVLGNVGAPDTSEIAQKTIVWVSVGLQSAATMRAWRRGFLNPKLAAMVAEARPPTNSELAQIDDRAMALHNAIQGRCDA